MLLDRSLLPGFGTRQTGARHCNTPYLTSGAHSCDWLQGIGIALLLAQAFIGTYSVIGISWMFTYFRDSFITKQDIYRWAEPTDEYKEGERSFNKNNYNYNNICYT